MTFGEHLGVFVAVAPAWLFAYLAWRQGRLGLRDLTDLWTTNNAAKGLSFSQLLMSVFAGSAFGAAADHIRKRGRTVIALLSATVLLVFLTPTIYLRAVDVLESTEFGSRQAFSEEDLEEIDTINEKVFGK